MMAVKSLPWPSSRVFAAALAMAAAVAPFASLRWLAVLVQGKRVRAWNALCRLASVHPDHYRNWCRDAAPRHEANWIGNAAAARDLATIRLADAGPISLTELLDQQAAQGAVWLAPMLANDSASPSLPQVLTAVRTRHPHARIIYWDEDVAGPDGPAQPWIKPGWDPLLHLARDCLSGACAVHIETARSAAARLPALPATAAGLTELLLAMLTRGVQPVHVPLLLTRRSAPPAHVRDWPALVQRHRPGWRVTAGADGLPFASAVPPDPATWPTVSIIIPTRDGADLLRVCLAGLAHLRYPGAVEIIVVDNGSRDPDALALMADEQAAGRIRLLRDDAPFNFARLNNRAAAVASGAYLCLLNNDVQALDGDWLAAMMRHAARPGVGAVGARLLYPDGRIQHAGVSVGTGGAAGHIQRGVDPASPDHAGWHTVTRQVSAVTAACLLVARCHYEAVGGLDEAGFAVAFNDVDFCLKLQAAGLANIWCAQATLVHAESRSRPPDARPDQAARFNREVALLQSRWNTAGHDDPHHSPLFSRSSEPCLLAML